VAHNHIEPESIQRGSTVAKSFREGMVNKFVIFIAAGINQDRDKVAFEFREIPRCLENATERPKDL
jgi:hypothetical protein